MTDAGRFDVAVVGASVAGCSAARLFARAGARVALIERRPDPGAYKVTCTHAILSSASPAIERLGLAPLLAARGAVSIVGDAWTPYGGWIRAPAGSPRGWGVTRRTLDPMLRGLAAETAGVEFMPGRKATRIVSDTGGRPAGVETETPEHRRTVVRATLVVGADGRHSAVARLAGVPGRVRPNNRFAYFAYWRGARPHNDRARVWLLDPHGGAHFPMENDLSVLVTLAHRARLPEFRADLDGAYRRMFDEMPGSPDLSQAEQVSKLIGSLEAPNVMRPAARPGLAFVGDAAVAADPLFGVGLSWAFQSAEWLVDTVAPAVLGGGDLDAALERYRRLFLRRVGLHHFVMSEFSSARHSYPWERVVLRAAAADENLARAFEEIGSRRRSPLRLLDPRLLPYLVHGSLRAATATD